MKKLIHAKTALSDAEQLLKNIPKSNIIKVTMFLRPEIYLDSEAITGSVNWDSVQKKYYTDVNPSRIINGPLSNYGEELEPPIKEEYDGFIEDCAWLIDNSGFFIISRYTSTDSEKSEYIIVFGMDDDPCGSIVFDLRISDHPLDAEFPEELKDDVLQYLKINKVLDESATKAGINFRVEKVTVGAVKDDTWGRAFDRLGNKLDLMRRKVRKQLKREHRNN